MPPLPYLRECFRYAKGTLYWRRRPRHHFQTTHRWRQWNSSWACRPAGSITAWGYLSTHLCGKAQRVHRLIAALHGMDTSAMIDHVDGNRLNNKLSNLRPATRSENMRNSNVGWSNTGVRGVSLSKDGGYYAYICVAKKKIHLGRFKAVEVAKAARLMAEKQHYGAFAPQRQEKLNCD